MLYLNHNQILTLTLVAGPPHALHVVSVGAFISVHAAHVQLLLA